MSQLSNLQIVAAALSLAYSTLDSLNSRHGKGSIKTVAVDINGTDLDSGIVKGHVTRQYGCGSKEDQRAFSLKVNKSGNVAVRFLDKRQTVSAS